MKRGQVALEFLLTYGYVLVAIIALAGVLVYLTGAYHVFLPAKCGIEQPFACLDYAAYEDGTVRFSVLNRVEEMAFVNFTLYCNRNRNDAHTFIQPGSLQPLQKLNGSTIGFSCPGKGGVVTGEIEITYKARNDNVYHTSYGSFRMEVGAS